MKPRARNVATYLSAPAVLYSPPVSIGSQAVPHSPEEKKRAIARLRRIRGQVDGLERAIEAGSDCGPVLQQIAALRGAVNGLMAGILDSHLREEFTQVAVDPKIRKQHQASIDEVIALVRSYLK